MNSIYLYNKQSKITENEANKEVIQRLEEAKRRKKRSSFEIDRAEAELCIKECEKCLKTGNYTHGIFPYWQLGSDNKSFADKVTGEIIWSKEIKLEVAI